METNKLIVQVTLDKANRRKDKAITLTFTTTLEQSTEQFMLMDQLLADTGILYFKSNGQLTTEEVKELDNVELEVEGKTKSQRLRNVLFVLWTKRESKTGDNFNEYYSHKMEHIIEHFKSLIEDE